MSPAEVWEKALTGIIAGRSPSTIAPIVSVSRETVRRWLRGERVPTATAWRSLVVDAGKDADWAALSAARDAVERKSGRPRLTRAERVERLRKQLEEVENG